MAVTLRKYLNNELKAKGLTVTEAKKNAGKYKSIAAAKKAGSLYYTDKNGKVMAAVYAEDLKKPLKSSLIPKKRPSSGSIKIEVLLPGSDKTIASAIEKGKNPMKFKDAAKKAGSLYYTNKDGKVMAAVYAEDLKKPLKDVKPKIRPTSGSVKVEVLVGSMTKSEVADAISKGKNPMNLAKAAKKKKATANKKGKPMNFSGNSKGGMAKKGKK